MIANNNSREEMATKGERELWRFGDTAGGGGGGSSYKKNKSRRHGDANQIIYIRSKIKTICMSCLPRSFHSPFFFQMPGMFIVYLI